MAAAAIFPLVPGLALVWLASNLPASGQNPPKIDPQAYRACGVTSLYAVCVIVGREVKLQRVYDLLQPKEDGSNTFAELAQGAQKLDFFPLAAQLRLEQLADLPAPAILHMRKLQGQSEGNHFVVYLGQTQRDGVVVLDAPTPPQEIERSRFAGLWTGNVLILSKSEKQAESLKETLVVAGRHWWSQPIFWMGCGVLAALGWLLVRTRYARQAAQEATVP